MGVLAHHGVKGQRWGVRKDIKSGDREKIISETETKIKADVDKYGALEASESVSTYAYEDAGKIMKLELGPDWKNASKEEKAPYGDLESELSDRYDDFGYNYAEQKRAKHSDVINKVLEHHGIRGQRWGVLTGGNDGKGPGASGVGAGTARRGGVNLDRLRKGPDTINQAKDVMNNRELLAQKTTQELRDLADRIDAENRLSRQISEYNKAHPSITTRVASFIGNNTKHLLGQGVNKVATMGFNKLMADLEIKVKGDPFKGLKDMSDQELKDAVARYGLEQSYMNYKQKRN